MVDESLSELATSKCVQVYPNGDVDPTPNGKIMSYYYLSHKTIRYLVKHRQGQSFFRGQPVVDVPSHRVRRASCPT